jgi:hypothetical protein
MNVKYAATVTLIAMLFPVVCLAASDGPIVYDPSVPPEEQCTVMLAATLTVTAFDGDEVRWKAKNGQNWATVQIPAGSHDFVIDYSRYVSAQGDIHAAKDVRFRYEDFAAGHTYRMWGAVGAEARGFKGMFDDIVGTMVDTVNKKFTVMVEDITK